MPRHSETTLAAIKNAVDIVSLVSDYGLQLTRSGSKYKALCPFHDDHRPSMELNPERQSYKCWSCGAGGDIFDFVKEFDRVDFPEALRMLAERAGIRLEATATTSTAPKGPTKSELRAAMEWSASLFSEELTRSTPARSYVSSRGLNEESVTRFGLGYAPGERGWLAARARRDGISLDTLERAGLVSRPEGAGNLVRERFRGRLMFPIHDSMGRTIGFGGRILPEVERFLASSGKNVAKYLNSPESPLFQKRRVLYAADLARPAAREEGWVAVVEGYTDVIAAHQVGLRNVVGTLGTALGDDHVVALRRLAEKVVLVFDGDAAGQSAADRSLELFLGHEVDVRVLTLPENLDPCEFLLHEGADAFRALVDRAVDPLAFALKRAGDRFDIESIEGSRQAAEWVLNVLARVPAANGLGIDVKVAKALDNLSSRLRVPVSTLERRLRQIRRTQRPARSPRVDSVEVQTTAEPNVIPLNTNVDSPSPRVEPDAAPRGPYRVGDLDPLDRELVQILLNEPGLVGRIVARVSVGSFVDAPLRIILQACLDLYGEGQPATFERVALRLDDPAVRALAAGLLLPLDPAPLPDVPMSGPSGSIRPASWEVRLEQVLTRLAERDRLERLRDLKTALSETNETDDPVAHRALKTEYLRLLTQRPDTKKNNAS